MSTGFDHEERTQIGRIRLVHVARLLFSVFLCGGRKTEKSGLVMQD